MNFQLFLLFSLIAIFHSTSASLCQDAFCALPNVTPWVFISYRFAEAKTVAVNLKSALDRRGVTGIVIDANPGGDSSILDTVVRAIDESALFVILGTRTYGRKTASLSATRQEMLYALESRKPLFVVKMCDEYEEHVTRFLLDSSIPYYDFTGFQENTTIPEGLVDQIVSAAWAAFEREN